MSWRSVPVPAYVVAPFSRGAAAWRREVMRCGSRTQVLSPQGWEGDGPQGRRVAGAASHFLPQPCVQTEKKP